MSPNTYDIGDVVRLEARFSDAQGAAVDPGTVVFKVRLPGGQQVVTIDGEVVMEEPGRYTADFEPTLAGRYFWRVEGTAPGQSAEERRFDVRTSHVLSAEAAE